MRHDELRGLTDLAHAVPGATLRLHCAAGAELLVSSACLGADLDACQLRATLLQSSAAGRLAAGVDRAEFVGGLRPLGMGMYERTSPVGERWFVSALAPSLIVAAIEATIEAAIDAAMTGGAADQPRH